MGGDSDCDWADSSSATDGHARCGRDFYTRLLGFDAAAELPAAGDPAAEAMCPIVWGGIVMARGNLLMG